MRFCGRIVDRTDGVPLFVEEVTKSLIESGLDVTRADIPATLQGSLLARLDRLGPEAKEIAQIGAVIGREFSHQLVAAIFARPLDELAQALDRLVGSELVFRSGTVPDAIYIFKHALVQDAAYDSLLFSRRKELHTRLVETLDGQSTDGVEDQTAQLAHHAIRAELWEQAIDSLRTLGDLALSRSAHREASNYRLQALQALAHLPSKQNWTEIGIDIRLDLRNSLTSLGDHQLALDHVTEAAKQAETIDDRARQVRGRAYVCNLNWHLGNTRTALESGQVAVTNAIELGDSELIVASCFFLGQVQLRLANYPEAIALCERSMNSLDPDRPFETFGLPMLPGPFCNQWISQASTELGEFSRAEAGSRRCVTGNGGSRPSL